MNKAVLHVALGIVLGALLVTGILSFGANAPAVLAQSTGGDDDAPPPQSAAAEVPTAAEAAAAANSALVYFTPQDTNGTATVLFLYNTSTTAQTVTITGYSITGAVYGTWNVPVAAKGFTRVVSDAVAQTTAPNWSEAVMVNFTGFVPYASMAVPAGIKADGYIVYNPTTLTVDPEIDQGALPIRFSSDPESIFMPSVTR